MGDAGHSAMQGAGRGAPWWPALALNDVASVADDEMTDPATAATFVFADIAGFTALTEAHGDEQAANLVADFSQAVAAELPASAGTRVKTIGDALMLRIPRVEDAIHFGLRLTHELMAGHGSPAVRVGLHHGTAVERDGDYFGSTVNLAARISALAVGGEVLVSGSTAALAPTIEGVIYEARGRHELRNIAEPVEIFAARRTTDRPGSKLSVDPVCQMTVEPQRAPGRLLHGDHAYFFCSLTCAGEFARHPERFAGTVPPAD